MRPDKKRVFVIYGRNTKAYDAMVLFLRSLGLDPWDFNQLSSDLGGAPFIGDIVRHGMKHAQAVVALFTPDEFAVLRHAINTSGATEPEGGRYQARPNVIYEAGMAMGIGPKRTVLVTLGSNVELFSDVHGIHIVQLDNTPKRRHLLRTKLIKMGCDVDMNAPCEDVDQAGDFESCLTFPEEPQWPESLWMPREPFGEWSCVWRAGEDWSTEDRIVLWKNADDIAGRGTNAKYGRYFLSGKISQSNMLTLLYHGEEDRVHARGVVLLYLNVTMTEMDGHWIECGYHGKKEFGRGETIWRKVGTAA